MLISISVMAASHWTKEYIYGNFHVLSGFPKMLLRKAAFCWSLTLKIALCIGITDGIVRILRYFMSFRFVHELFQEQGSKFV